MSPPALLLLPGDPLPPLPVLPPLHLVALAGQWLLLLSCDPARLAELPALIAGLHGARRCPVRALVRQTDQTPAAPEAAGWQVHADVAGRAADALGALDTADGRADVAVLLDPRAQVQAALIWQDTATLVAAVRRLLLS